MASNATAVALCPTLMKATSNGIFQGDNPLDFALPLVILQICLVVALTRGLAFLLRPLKQPRVIGEIIGGILLGPSALGRNKNFLHTIFPSNSITLLDTIANIGLLFFLFLVGLELDLKSIRRTGKKALGIAITGICVPFALGIGSSFVLRETISKGVNASAFLIFMGVALSITAFPVLARILAELKLLTTDVGRMAMSAAAVNDVAAWILLALAIALSGSDKSPLTAVWVLLSGCSFVVAAIVVLSPVFKWMTKQCFQGEPVREIYICTTLAIVLAAGFFTDFIGIHAMFGAFVVGVLVPKDGPLVGALVEKIEDLVSALFLPLYFVSSGLKTNVATIQGAQSWGLLVLVIVTACSGKILGTFLVSLLCKVPVREALALGFLMNTKGLVELIVLNIGKDRKVLNDQTFAIMILMALFTTFITTPLVIAVYKPARSAKLADYKHRKIERKNKNTQLRMLTCFHSAGNVPSIINLLEASRGIQKGEELCVYAMHLMELSERSSAILMVHKARKNGLPFWNRGQRSDTNHVIVAFEAYQQLRRVFIRPMTAISSMSDIHEDICATAERKRTAIIILPFHKHQRVDGSLETTRSSIRVVNQNVLGHARCSVGIFVDRGLGGTTHVMSSNVSLFITVLFFGGGDDREALSYGVRMAEHPGIRLMVIRFFVEPEPVGEIVSADTVGNSSAKTVSQDDEFLSEFKRNVSKNDSIIYVEKTIKSVAEAMDTVQDLKNCNLYLVGRSPDVQSTFALNRSDCPELGPVGNLLISPNFPITASVLVVQQYRSELPLNSASDSAGESESA
ncbi:cation/H(+) antiporter 18-like [Benincasa hispida]|uniref:cation/H(+) antiporter 18-like n=1 Tax=Benincasa hispida TaxID=102211 RepID=UPI00190285BC|nr:cation/H(+) antiporter 18-like [Benincasa hispida]XP_038878015.1 cation/H(+) antiporter 18-like [Benincasa hispida]XP_038878016.1 cation/H(+) antiporter 18-like [Benincasa hispida]XP_038878017.1 cation/H(+) antiporter 18-like [Benincasa hispida]